REGNAEGEAAEGRREVHDLVALALNTEAGPDRAHGRHADGGEIAGRRVADVGGALGLVADLGEADVAEGFVRAVDAEVRRHVTRIDDAVGDQSRVRLTDADQTELAAEVGISAVDLGGAAGLGDVFAVQTDQHANGDAVVEGRLAREVHTDFLTHRHGLAAEIAQAGGRDTGGARYTAPGRKCTGAGKVLRGR